MPQKIKQDLPIGANIRKYRLAMNLTQGQLAAYMQLRGCDIGRSTLSHIESGDYNIKLSYIVTICEILKIDFNTLFSNLDK